MVSAIGCDGALTQERYGYWDDLFIDAQASIRADLRERDGDRRAPVLVQPGPTRGRTCRDLDPLPAARALTVI
jgi:hypothetical protein